MTKLQASNAAELAKNNSLREAAGRLRSEFASALAQLDLARRFCSTHDAPDVNKFMYAEMLKHAAAIEIYRVYVPESERSEYLFAFKAYYDTVKDEFFMAKSSNDMDPWSIYESRIHNILKFAKV